MVKKHTQGSGSSFWRGLGTTGRWRVLGSSQNCRLKLERCVDGRRGARTPSEHGQGTLEQGSELPNAHGTSLRQPNHSLSPLPKYIFKMPDVFKFLRLKINLVFLSFSANPGCGSEFSVPHSNSHSQLIYAHRNHK